MDDPEQTERRAQMYDELAKYLCCAWIAYRLGVTLPTAKKQVEKALREKGREYPGAAWYHAAEFPEALLELGAANNTLRPRICSLSGFYKYLGLSARRVALRPIVVPKPAHQSRERLV